MNNNMVNPFPMGRFKARVANKDATAWPGGAHVFWEVSWIILLCFMALLTSCANFSSGTNFHLSGLDQLEVGTTTKAQVLQLFGPPWQRVDVAQYRKQRLLRFGDEETDLIWRHDYYSQSLAQTSSRFLQVEFDSTGRVVDYFFYIDLFQRHHDHSESTTQPAGQALERVDSIPEKGIDFDIARARKSINPGTCARSEVAALLGTNYATQAINKPDVAERWQYGYSQARTTTDGKESRKIYRKWVNIDFDANGAVRHIKGESNFPEDLAGK